MRTTIAEAYVGPYGDGSGFRHEVAAKWQRDDAKDIVAHVEIKQGGDTLIVTFKEWVELSSAIETAIRDTGWRAGADGQHAPAKEE